jgi:hypothetical protein
MYIYGMKLSLKLLSLALILCLSAPAQNSIISSEAFNYYLHRNPARPLTVDPHKWAEQPLVNTWDSMEAAFNAAQQNRDGYGIYQLAYLEYVHNYTMSKLNPKTMLYRAFEIGKTNGDPYLMYWVTHLEGTVYFHYEYLERRRHHAEWTDSVATEKKEWPVLYLLAEMNIECFKDMKSLASKYLQCANLKEESFGLLNYDVLQKAQEMEKNATKK